MKLVCQGCEVSVLDILQAVFRRHTVQHSSVPWTLPSLDSPLKSSHGLSITHCNAPPYRESLQVFVPVTTAFLWIIVKKILGFGI